MDNLNEYQVQKILWDDLEPDEHKTIDPDIANARIAQTKPHLNEEIIEKAKDLNDKADKAGIRTSGHCFKKRLWFKKSFTVPIISFSLINNMIPYQPVRYMVDNAIKDRAFDASIKFLLSLITFPAFYIIISIILGLSGLGWPFVLGYLLLSILTAPLFVQAKDLFTGSPKRKLKKKDPDLYSYLKNELKEFIRLRETILSE
ncbi:MAG: hypothetical protein U5K71_11120 [Gracilimonas sp.]|nr:hypothetical protein [Gracilimonas sp.]